MTTIHGCSPELSIDRTVSEEAIERVVRKLNMICKTATLEFALAVGAVIIDNFYARDLGAWRSRGPKDASFRSLAKHPALPMSPSALCRSVAIYELCQRLGWSTWNHISTSHLRLVLRLEASDQESMIKRAEIERWPVRRLEAEVALVAACRPSIKSKGGKKRQSDLRRTIRALEKCVDASNNLVGAAEDKTEPTPDSARSMVDVLRRVTYACMAAELRVIHCVQRHQSGDTPSTTPLLVDRQRPSF